MKCMNCSHEQDSGKFCGKCGNALVAQTTTGEQSDFYRSSKEHDPIINQPSDQSVMAAAPAYQLPTEPNIHVEKVKETSKQYWTYFLQYLKRPSLIFDHASSNFVNAIISFLVFALLITLSLHKNIGLIAAPFSGFSEQESIMPSFFSIFISTTLTISILFLLSIASIFIISKFFGPDVPFKNLFTIVGTHLIPFIVVAALAYVLLLIDSLIFGNILFIISLLFSLFILPLFVVSRLLSKQSQSIDSLYAYLSYIVLFVIGFSIISSILVDSTIGQYISELNYFF